MSVSIEQCLKILPQTQCQECGYQGCRPYAAALLDGSETSISRCLPGGQPVADHLALLLQKDKESARPIPAPMTAFVDLNDCIGCSLCLKACPVDAIWGAQGFEHQVWEADCTACGLCIPACPTGCLSLVSRDINTPLPSSEDNLARIQRKQKREEQIRAKKWEAHRHAIAKR